MSEHMNHKLTSLTRFFSPLLLPWVSSFDFRSTALVQLQGFFSSLSYFTFSPSPKIFFLFSFYFPVFSKVRTYLRVGFLTTCSRGTPRNVISIHPSPSFSLFSISSILYWWDAYARTLYVAFSAFLSTENDFHHNLRPNIGDHTSCHNSRVPSEKATNLNGCGGVFFHGRRKGANEGRLKVSKEKAERERENECNAAAKMS